MRYEHTTTLTAQSVRIISSSKHSDFVHSDESLNVLKHLNGNYQYTKRVYQEYINAAH